jgi:hypothetical protein
VGSWPSLFGTKTTIRDAVGYAVIGGRTVSVTGAPMNFSSEDWVWGGAAQVGATYFVGPRWFLDLNYTYARSEEYTVKYSQSFTNRNGPLTSEGTANLIAHQQLTTQSIVLTLNRMFCGGRAAGVVFLSSPGLTRLGTSGRVKRFIDDPKFEQSKSKVGSPRA